MTFVILHFSVDSRRNLVNKKEKSRGTGRGGLEGTAK